MSYKPDANGVCQNVDSKGRLCGEVHDPKGCQGHVKDSMGRRPARAGKQCGQPPITGLQYCRVHGGSTEKARAKAARVVERREVERSVSALLREMGTPETDIHDGEALVAMRALAAAKVFLYGRLVAELPETELWHATYHHSGEATGEAKPDIRVVLHDAERDRLARLDEVCVKLGFDARRVRVAEAELGWLFDCVTRSLSVLPPDLRTVFQDALVAELRRDESPLGTGGSPRPQPIGLAGR